METYDQLPFPNTYTALTETQESRYTGEHNYTDILREIVILQNKYS